MRPIYTNGQKTLDSASSTAAESAYKTDAKVKSFSQAKSMFESVSEEDVNNNNVSSRRWTRKETLDKYTSVSPVVVESNGKSVRAGIAAFQNSSLNDDSMASTSPELVNANDSALFSNVDTTPLFSPSQILKLNRQRLARNSDEQKQPAPECLQQNYHKLSHVKSGKSTKDLNNNTHNEGMGKSLLSNKFFVVELGLAHNTIALKTGMEQKGELLLFVIKFHLLLVVDSFLKYLLMLLRAYVITGTTVR